MSTRAKLILGLLLALFAYWVVSISLGGSVEEPRAGLSVNAAAVEPTAELRTDSPNPNINVLSTNVVRETVTPTISALTIKNWLGLQVMQGEIYFCNDSAVSRIVLTNGRASIPNFDWTHALVVIQNHAPYFVDRDSIMLAGSTGILQMPEPTFVAQIIAEGHVLTEIRLVVDYPWVDSKSWPQSLRQNFTVPIELPLHLDPETQTTYFVGAPGSSTTISCRKNILIETPRGLSRTVEYPPQSTKELVILRGLPRLTIGVDPASGSAPEALCRVRVTLKKRGVWDQETSWLVGSNRYAEWSLTYDPSYTSASVIVTNQEDGLQLGSAEFELTGFDQLEVVELSQGVLSISVLDDNSIGIPGVLIVQAGATLATTNSVGFAKVPLNMDAGKVWFLSKHHDAISIVPKELLADPIVYMGAATGVMIQCHSENRGSNPIKAILFEIEGLTFSAVLWEAEMQAHQVYGLSSLWAERSEGGASYIFQKDIGKHGSFDIWLAGVFEVQQQTQTQLSFFDEFQQIAWNDSISVFPNKLSTRSLNLADVFQTISVSVVGTDKTPLVGASVSIFGSIGLDSAVQTNSEGRASLLVSRKADSVLSVQMAGYVDQRVPWPQPAGNDVVHMSPARLLRIQVLDPSGGRVDVDLVLTDGISRWHGGTKTQGVFQFTGIPKGELQARITKDGRTLEYEVPPDIDTFTLTHSQ